MMRKNRKSGKYDFNRLGTCPEIKVNAPFVVLLNLFIYDKD